MNNSDETLKKPLENEAVLQAIAELARTVAEVAGKVETLSGNFESLSGKVESLSSNFESLSGKVENLSGRFDNLENFVTVQFEAVREGIEYNSARYDRMEAKFFDVRSDVSNMRADIKELSQTVRRKELV